MSIGVTPLTQAKLYKSLTLNKLTYGLEVSNRSSCIMDIMDKFQRESATSFQGLPRCTSTPSRNCHRLEEVTLPVWAAISSLYQSVSKGVSL